jgi:hypothetical protein
LLANYAAIRSSSTSSAVNLLVVTDDLITMQRLIAASTTSIIDPLVERHWDRFNARPIFDHPRLDIPPKKLDT